MRTCSHNLALLFLLAALPAAAGAEPIPSPDEYFGHQMGADRRLVSYDEFLPYYELLARESDRVSMQTVGRTTMGRDMVMVLLSSPENLPRADRYREISARLDDPRGLSEEAVESLVAEGKVVLLVALSIHSSEIMASQMGMEWTYQLTQAAPGSDLARYLEDVIVLLLPSMNPDGQVLITDWYRKYAGTRFEGGVMPWLYHPYSGHDNNRDWFMLNLHETRVINRLAYHEWFPQVLVDEHQMGATGPRAFVPPYSDPVTDKVHPLIHRSALLFGANMAMDLERQGKSGVIYGYSFDAYWPGGNRSTPWWKNTVGILTEIASARMASPLYIDPSELAGGRKGLPDYRAQVNFPNPWPGGWWRPRDIVEYELIITSSALKTSSLHREEILANRAAMARDAIRLGEVEEPYGYVIPPGQNDPGTAARLVDLLLESGLEVYRAPSLSMAGSQAIPAGSFVVPAAQPYRSYLVEMMEPQSYPEVRVGIGSEDIYPPYDVTSWSLPYLMGVKSWRLEAPEVWPLEQVTESAWNRPSLPDTIGSIWALSPAHTEAYAAVWRLFGAGVEVRQATAAFRSEGRSWPAGTFLVRTSAATMNHALEGLRAQAWCIDTPLLPPAAEESGGGADPVPTRRLQQPRLGIYQSWLAPMDEGWTRFVRDEFGIPYRILHDRDLQAGNLHRSLDVILFPDQSRQEIVGGTGNGNGFSEPRPEPYDGGLETKGVEAVERFVQDGGTMVALGRAVEFPLTDFTLPVADVTAGIPRSDFSTPGAMLRVKVDTTHPLAYGQDPDALVYHNQDPVLGTRPSSLTARRSVVMRFADNDEVLVSGWARGTRILERKAALVQVSYGEGEIDLFAFRPQHRAQTRMTYRLLFNAFLEAAAVP